MNEAILTYSNREKIRTYQDFRTVPIVNSMGGTQTV